MDIRGLNTGEASIHYPASGTRLEADSAAGVGRVEASGQLLETRTCEVEIEQAQRRVRRSKGRLKRGQPPDTLRRPTFQPTSVPPND